MRLDFLLPFEKVSLKQLLVVLRKGIYEEDQGKVNGFYIEYMAGMALIARFLIQMYMYIYKHMNRNNYTWETCMCYGLNDIGIFIPHTSEIIM